MDIKDVNGNITDNGCTGNTETIGLHDKFDNPSQLLPPSPRLYPGGDETNGEELASDTPNNERSTPGKKWKWHNTGQAGVSRKTVARPTMRRNGNKLSKKAIQKVS
jgi:hypothetical protein